MKRNLYFPPWDGHGRFPASFLERHCALCRVHKLPYSTPPKEVPQEGDIKLLDLDKMFEWKPDEYDADALDPFDELRSTTAVWEHYGIFGGRGSSKSHGAADAIVELASTRKERVASAREFMKRIKESSKELLETKIKESPWSADWETTDYELRNTRTGSVIFFIGLAGHNAESVGKSLEAVTLLWVDEAQLMSQRSIDIIQPTIRELNSRCLWTWNPGEDPSPVDLLFRGPNPPERSLVVCKLVEENPYLYRSRLASEMRSSFQRDTAEKYQHIWRGAHLEITESTIFTDIEQGYLDFNQLPCRGMGHNVHELYGMDFGYGGSDPSAAVRIYVVLPQALPDYVPEDSRKPIIYVSRESVERSVANHELWRLPVEVGATGRLVLCDSAMPLMITALDVSGKVSAQPAVKGQGSLLAGLRKLQSCRIIVSPTCPITWSELKGLRWVTDKLTNKVKKPLTPTGEDHCVAAIRYAISELELTEAGGMVYV